MLSRLALLALLSARGAVAQWPDPVPSTGNLSYVHDPNVVAKDGTYYRFSTFGGIYIASAPDMSGPWTALGEALAGGSSIPLRGNTSLWAPDVSLVNGTYHMYYAVSVSGSQNSDMGVATSSQLTPGSWTDHGSIGVPRDPSYNKIDPNLLLPLADGDATQPPILAFGSYWRDIFQVEMARPPLTVAEGAAAPVNVEYNGTLRGPKSAGPPEVMEGAFQFPYRDGAGKLWYYLFWSSGECCNVPPKLAPPGNEYKIMVARAESPTGPWSDDLGRDTLADNGGRLVLGSHGSGVYAPGGQGVMVDPKTRSPLMYYHYVDPRVGYGVYDFQFGFNYLDFASGWPVVVEKPVSNGTVTANAPPQGSQTPKPNAAAAATARNGVSLMLSLISALSAWCMM